MPIHLRLRPNAPCTTHTSPLRGQPDPARPPRVANGAGEPRPPASLTVPAHAVPTDKPSTPWGPTGHRPPSAVGDPLSSDAAHPTPKVHYRSRALARLLGHKSRIPSALLALLLPGLVLAQASPFQTGATALQTNLLTLLTPVAIILVIGLGVMAMANRIAWGWCIGAIAGIAVAFGAPQIVGWIRGMFGV